MANFWNITTSRWLPMWGYGRLENVHINLTRLESTFWYEIVVTNGHFYYKKRYTQQEVRDEEDLGIKMYYALLAYWFDEEWALNYMDSMKVQNEQKTEARETPISRHESPYNPTPIIILWLITGSPRITDDVLETLSTRQVVEEAMEAEKEILEITNKVAKEKNRHYQTYGTLLEKSKAYLSSIFK